MRSRFGAVLALSWMFSGGAATAFAAEAVLNGGSVLDEVNVFVGSDNNGNTTPGAQTPFGFVSFGPDTVSGSTNGYDSKSPAVGFSLTHVSGTGGNSKYGNFRITPSVGPVDPRNLVFARHNEAGSPGFYRTDLAAGAGQSITVELAASRMAGIAQITFPRRADANLILDATSAVQLMGSGPRATSAETWFIDERTFAGRASFTGGWNEAPLTLYFHAVLDRSPTAYGTWSATRGSLALQTGGAAISGGDQTKDHSNRLGAYAVFDARENPRVRMRIAVSFTSVEQARANLESEIPNFELAAIQGRAAEAWGEALGKIKVEGGSTDERRSFYSGLYRSHVMPHDVTGENAGWSGPGPHYEDYYTLWDTFRTLHPLLTVIQPKRQRDMINSLLETYRRTGWLPDARIAGANGMTQGGSNSDVLIADAVVKQLGGFDAKLAFQAIRKNGEVESDDQIAQGRALKDYLSLGYMSQTQTRSASRTLEYAYDDFAIAQVAQALGQKADAARYLKRSQNWTNLWDEELKCIRPRYADGAWMANFSCDHLYPDNTSAWWDAPFYEGSSAQYSTYVPHDVEGLIGKLGGEAGFVSWLDRLFDSGGYEQGNEPDFLAPYLYIHAGRPDRAAERVRHILKEEYSPTHGGLPGNDDAGAMSSWYVWSAIGLFPNAGQPFYYIGSPIFERAVISLENGRTFTVSAKGAGEAIHVVGARLNGKPIDRAWITHQELAAGGVLELTMAQEPGVWARRFSAPPNPFRPRP
ncbi:GH92 family glycosyl hydrolase [Caulobacter segnis]|uniref:GH92 family glycosyl hydrolase n=1 Tax=Caulobacter segnis TaxID=88688 RepID=UPI00240EC633|nr:GH92 family glycosyl hydrolase [Caulobacter segnis]MDG2520676.1 GH92 family glycosyl hydrolase [Caulobacter segnis]